MKMVLAIIQPTKLAPLQEALAKIEVTRMTVCDAQGYARPEGGPAAYRGHHYKTNLLRKILLEIAVNDDFLQRTIDCIAEIARTGPKGNVGDGRIFVLPMDDAVQIREPIRGKEAI